MLKWEQDVKKGLFEKGSLKEIYHSCNDNKIAIECARRLAAFHKGKDPKQEALYDHCFLLTKWGSAKKAVKHGIVKSLGNWKKENITIWVNITEEFYGGCVEPLIKRFTEEELQNTFMWN